MNPIPSARPTSTPPQLHRTGERRTVTFQLWHWHEDGEHYDLEHFQLLPEGADWRVRTRRATYWALGQDRLTALAAEAGFADPEWHTPAESGFFQPLLTATRGQTPPPRRPQQPHPKHRHPGMD
ncbi:hypothetical protein [Streptomyces cavernicola]|uniref:hypothetical protein n=1 Tax=Streptomyces cavernicola TaxID=3043613 RepID=UPI0032B7863C